jgi:hypothetical protein
MDDQLTRLWSDLIARVGGPMSLRLVLQPLMALTFAVRDGARDAKERKPLYFWSILTDPAHRGPRLREGWKAVTKVFTMALVIDCVYQFVVRRWIYPVEALIVAFVLACVPYVLVRGPANRLMRMRQQPLKDGVR